VDYFLWGYLKERVYAGKSHTAVELKQSIRREIVAIPVDMLSRTVFRLKERARECSLRGGEHLRDVIFKS